MFWLLPARSSVSRLSEVAKPDPEPADGALGPRLLALRPSNPAGADGCDARRPAPPGLLTSAGFAGIELVRPTTDGAPTDDPALPPPACSSAGGAPGGIGGLGAGGGCEERSPDAPPPRLSPARPPARSPDEPAMDGSFWPSWESPRCSAAAPRSCARSGCACGTCGTCARCWQNCGHSGRRCLNCSSASLPKANILLPMGLRSASRTHRSATPRVMLTTSWWLISRPNSTAVIRSSFSGYLGKNRYSSKRLWTMHPNMSRSLAICDPLNRVSMSTVCSTVC
mmetsp:Transcript_4976/g.18655  ORF Transcript_4976/g.18655 Transcript_4976/m.18655 type:complete len:282 (-) Transcript_4976:226-1071(-)